MSNLIHHTYITKKPRVLPNLPIGTDEGAEIDNDWKAISFNNYNRSHRYDAVNTDSIGINSTSVNEGERSSAKSSIG